MIWNLTITTEMLEPLLRHLFPGDLDEHGAVILAGVVETASGLRLVARELYFAKDGVDYVPGKHGYRMLRAQFIQPLIIAARDRRLAYLAIHNHRGTNSVGFSRDDLESHERGYPALRDISRGMPVGALVFAQSAVAGQLWYKGQGGSPLGHMVEVGLNRRVWRSSPLRQLTADPRFDRQARLFGDAGQAILAGLKVGIVGLGGGGSVLAELLGRLGVGTFVLADHDCVDDTNLCRLVGADQKDADPNSPMFKVAVAARNIARANPLAKIEEIRGDIVFDGVAKQFVDCDYIFLAADSMRARLVFNAIVHQYGIPGYQVGVKIRVSEDDGIVGDVMCLARSVTSESGCLICNGLIDFGKLQEEGISEQERKQQRYLDEDEMPAASVVTLNSIACAHAANAFLFHATGLTQSDTAHSYFRYMPRTAASWRDKPRKDLGCSECGKDPGSRYGYGDAVALPTSHS